MCTKDIIAVLTMLLCAVLCSCDSSDEEGGGGAAASCTGCAADQSCCESWSHFHCVTTALHREHCGSCGHACPATDNCENGECVPGTACSTMDAGACDGRDCCLDICCPAGTSCVANPSTFHGCCPDGEACGCVGNDCPMSRRVAKSDIAYLTPAQRDAYRTQLLGMRLATYRYRRDGDGRRHLGFIMEDVEPSVAADSNRGVVDLYSYTSMTVATLQSQAAEIAALRAEVAALRRQLDRPATPPVSK